MSKAPVATMSKTTQTASAGHSVAGHIPIPAHKPAMAPNPSPVHGPTPVHTSVAASVPKPVQKPTQPLVSPHHAHPPAQLIGPVARSPAQPAQHQTQHGPSAAVHQAINNASKAGKYTLSATRAISERLHLDQAAAIYGRGNAINLPGRAVGVAKLTGVRPPQVTVLTKAFPSTSKAMEGLALTSKAKTNIVLANGKTIAARLKGAGEILTVATGAYNGFVEAPADGKIHLSSGQNISMSPATARMAGIIAGAASQADNLVFSRGVGVIAGAGAAWTGPAAPAIAIGAGVAAGELYKDSFVDNFINTRVRDGIFIIADHAEDSIRSAINIGKTMQHAIVQREVEAERALGAAAAKASHAMQNVRNSVHDALVPGPKPAAPRPHALAAKAPTLAKPPVSRASTTTHRLP